MKITKEGKTVYLDGSGTLTLSWNEKAIEHKCADTPPWFNIQKFHFCMLDKTIKAKWYASKVALKFIWRS
jgi:hypothetical protein